MLTLRKSGEKHHVIKTNTTRLRSILISSNNYYTSINNHHERCIKILKKKPFYLINLISRNKFLNLSIKERNDAI